MIPLSLALDTHYRLARRAVPIAIITVTPACAAHLGVRECQLTRVAGQVLSASIDVPPGEWLVWPADRRAVWIGRRLDALPAVVRTRFGIEVSVDVTRSLSALADTGVWLREAALLTSDGWSASRRSGELLDSIGETRPMALSGIFVDQRGRSTRLEIAGSGIWWTDRPALALEWLLVVNRLVAPE